ncbi:recombinase family protein, partial [Staphylococcus epidermidis]
RVVEMLEQVNTIGKEVNITRHTVHRIKQNKNI